MLCKTWLVHVYLVDIAGTENFFTGRKCPGYADRDISIHTSIAQSIQYASLFIAQSLLLVCICSAVQQNLPQRDTAEP